MSINRSRWAWRLLHLSRQIWFRAAVFALLSIASALIAIAVAPFLPSGIAQRLGADAVRNILEILASSMLIVATFSLSTVISAYSAASADTTPRVSELLMQDPTAQNALSTFVGGFLFALVGIIGLSTNVYGEDGHIVLFAMTLLVVLVIVVTFLRWVDVLSRFGRVPDAIERTATAAGKALSGWIAAPHLGGRPATEAPEMTGRVSAGRMGYVRHIDVAALQEVAQAAGGEIRVTASPGAFVGHRLQIAQTTFEPDERCCESIRAAFDIADNRTFDQDPEYGISALAEIGIKALSPAINDPVTAIRVIDRLVRVLTDWGNAPAPEDPRYDRVYLPPLESDVLFDIAFSQLALYSARDVRVGIRLQEACRTLADVKDRTSAEAAGRQAARALAHAREGMPVEDDYRRLCAINESGTAG